MEFRVIVKILITAVTVVAISELAKRSSTAGAILAALPVTSLLALIWLYLDTRNTEKVADLSMGIFWAVIPSLAFFPILTWLVRTNLSYVVALLISCVATIVIYWAYFFLLKQFGVKL